MSSGFGDGDDLAARREVALNPFVGDGFLCAALPLPLLALADVAVGFFGGACFAAGFCVSSPSSSASAAAAAASFSDLDSADFSFPPVSAATTGCGDGATAEPAAEELVNYNTRTQCIYCNSKKIARTCCLF